MSTAVILDASDIARRDRFVIDAQGQNELIYLNTGAGQAGKTLNIKYNLPQNTSAKVFTKITAGITLKYEAELAKGAEIRFYGLTETTSGARTEIEVLVNHKEGENYSEQKFYSYAGDDSQVSFKGMISVASGSGGAIAHQLHRGVLLSDTARIDAEPFLNIMHDDVRCTHGSTVGFVDHMALQYLQARGIDRAEAKRILIQSSQRQFYDALPDDEARKLFGDAGEIL